ncbi:MAG: DUF3775 domain-containing protein [Proteobacteria bacterium]|nr:DUF3775 domain-containing protein [Pseudomonadota bacterium]
MININPELVCQIIDKARQFHAKEEVVIPEPPNSPADESIMQVLQDHGDDLTYQEVSLAIKDLEPDQQQELVALMWLGRDDYTLEEWETALQDAADRWNERTAEYLLATPLVADYLMEGLGLHGYSC